MSSIAVLGSANMDLVVRQPRLPLPGETMFGSDFSTVPGGKGLNQAVAAARAGGDVALLGAVGADAFGTELRAALVREGIDVDGVVVSASPSGTAHISVVDGGENSIVVVPGANSAVTRLDSAARRLITSAQFLVAQFERPIELIHEAFELAGEAGVTTVLTPAPVMDVPSGLLELTDYLIPNANEACELAGVGDDAEAAEILSLKTGSVIVTRGSRGVIVAREGEVVLERAARSVRAVDTTGAGDTFVGVLIARLAAGASLDQALSAATVGASIAVTRPGASTSMPTWEEITSTMSELGNGVL
ncbi:ribokinase [Okibacterium endophyticum]